MNVTLTEETTRRLNYLSDSLSLPPESIIESWFNILVDGDLIEGFMNPVHLVNAMAMNSEEFERETGILARMMDYFRYLTSDERDLMVALASTRGMDADEFIRMEVFKGCGMN